MLNFANMQLVVRLLFVSQLLNVSLSATRFLPETCAWHQEHYREEQYIAQLEDQENAIRAQYKYTLRAASMLAQAHAEQFAVNTHAWPALNDMVLRDATMSVMSLELPLYSQVNWLSYVIIELTGMIKTIDMQTLDGARHKPWQIAQKKRLKSLCGLFKFIYGHMVQTEQYKKEKAVSKIMRKI